MCASALKQYRIRSVYYGCANDRFGGTGGVLTIHSESVIEHFLYTKLETTKLTILIAAQSTLATRCMVACSRRKRSCSCAASTFKRMIKVSRVYSLRLNLSRDANASLQHPSRGPRRTASSTPHSTQWPRSSPPTVMPCHPLRRRIDCEFVAFISTFFERIIQELWITQGYRSSPRWDCGTGTDNCFGLEIAP